jgi:hypothetical protein
MGFVLGGQPVPGVVKNSRNFAAVYFPLRLHGGILNWAEDSCALVLVYRLSYLAKYVVQYVSWTPVNYTKLNGSLPLRFPKLNNIYTMAWDHEQAWSNHQSEFIATIFVEDTF